MIFPAMIMISKGIASLISARQIQRDNLIQQETVQNNRTPLQPLPASYGDIRARQTGEIVQPSVTENTTRLL
jgi:hypothetical protein